MKLRVAGLIFAAMMFAAAPAFAGSVSISFNHPGGTLGVSHAYGTLPLTVTAYGYKCHASSATSTSLTSCAGSALYGKNDGVGETGLGLAGENDQEIGWNDNKHDYIMGLDLSNLVGHVTSITLSFGSVQKGENYTLWGYASNPFTSGSLTLTNQLLSVNGNSNSTADYTSTISLNSSDEFLVITSKCGDVLLGSLSGTAPNPTPEPGTLLLFGSGLLVAGFAMRRRFAGQTA